MDVLLASTVMVVAGVSVLLALALRTWSRASQERYYELRSRILDYDRRIVAMEKIVSDTQTMLNNLRRKAEE
jgi:membrane protein implicated in regulation of membrane protease activity